MWWSDRQGNPDSEATLSFEIPLSVAHWSKTCYTAYKRVGGPIRRKGLEGLEPLSDFIYGSMRRRHLLFRLNLPNSA